MEKIGYGYQYHRLYFQRKSAIVSSSVSAFEIQINGSLISTLENSSRYTGLVVQREIDSQSLAPGLYFIHFLSSEGTQVRKLVKY